MLNDDKRCIEEAYVSATTTSDMRVVTDSDRQGDAETIIAAGMSKSLAGACFIRLHGEWSSVEKPRMPTVEAVRKLTDSMTFDQMVKTRADLKLNGIGNLKPTQAAEFAAQALARAWYISEVENLLGKLKSFRSALAYLVARSGKWDNRPEPMLRQTALEVLIWWLDKQCPRCNGTKYEVVPGSNRLSNRLCPSPSTGGCGGSGLAKLPRAEDGRRVATYLDDCCQIARTNIKARMKRYTTPTAHRG